MPETDPLDEVEDWDGWQVVGYTTEDLPVSFAQPTQPARPLWWINRLRTGTRCRARHDRGASSVEYALFLAAIAAVLVTAVVAFGGMVTASLDRSCGTLQTGLTGSQVTTCPPGR